jgi:death-on-curing protein
MQYRLLKLDEVLKIHDRIIKEQGESERNEGVLSMDSLLICIDSPSRNIFGFEPFDTLYKKTAILMFEIIQLHPFVDGNKRTAFLSGFAFLKVNDQILEVSLEESVEMMIGIAEGARSYEELVEFVVEHSSKELDGEDDLIRIDKGSFDPFKPNYQCVMPERSETFEISMIA